MITGGLDLGSALLSRPEFPMQVTEEGTDVVQVNPDEDSRQRLKMIRGEIDEPMRSAAPGRTAQQELAQQDVAQAAQDAGAEEPSRAAADSAAASAQPQAIPEEPHHADEDNDSDPDDDGRNYAAGPHSHAD